MVTKARAIKKPAGALQLHIELRYLRPRIWRRVLVPETITLAKLHSIIQAAFQWGGGHLHEFMAGEERYGMPDPDFGVPGEVRSERTRLIHAMTPAGTINYIYDFGDNWEHCIKVEKVLPPLEMKLPMCIGGANAAPPDDCGGPPGYMDFVEAMANPEHPAHEDMRVWIGRDDWDPEAFDIDHVNSRLAKIKL